MTEDSSYAAKVDEAREMMREILPPYVLESLVAAGYDTLNAISEIEEPGSTMNEIEEFINYQYKDDARFAPTANGQCKFLPGHRCLIKSFIKDVKRKRNAPVLKRKLCETQNKASTKKARVCDELPSQESIVRNIRQQISKWQRTAKLSKNKDYLRSLKEHKDYEVHVTSDDSSKVTIHCCLCMQRISLGTKSDKYLISNWTRHLVHACKPVTQTETIQTYFTSMSSSDNSDDIAQPSTAFQLALHVDHSFRLSPLQ